MASPEVEKLIGRAEREAEQQDIELDAVRKIESEADGITLRVLETDAESEEDQVGFQVTQPTGVVRIQHVSTVAEEEYAGAPSASSR